MHDVRQAADPRGTGTPDDVELLDEALGGDAEAVATLYDRHAGALFRLAACLVGPAAAETVVADVLVQGCTRRGVVTSHGSVRSELLVLTGTACRRHMSTQRLPG